MTIGAENLGKRYQRNWIFRGLTHSFRPGTATALLGPNGAGKSTLLNTLAGQLLPTEGQLTYSLAGHEVPAEALPQHLAYAAPYLELPEELTLRELLRFHTHFKPLQTAISTEKLIGLLYLEKAADQLVREFSSGMKQRLKLGLALYAAAPLLLLDEPTTNLDATGVAWFREQVRANRAGRTLLISSNVPAEYDFCDAQLVVTDWQGSRSAKP